MRTRIAQSVQGLGYELNARGLDTERGTELFLTLPSSGKSMNPNSVLYQSRFHILT
jgi:hypothetical protein